jgi:HSP20 family protein
MALIRWKDRDLYDPWAELRNIQDEINSLFDLDRVPVTTGLFDRNVSPAIDVAEGAADYTVTCELPGLEQKDIDVTIASNVLTIKGQKKNEWEEKKGKSYKKESWSGSFQRTLPLPTSVDGEKIKAELKDGVLMISLPKKQEAKPKQISVNVK